MSDKWKGIFLGITVIVSIVGGSAGFLWCLTAHEHWSSTGYVFMPEQVTVPVDGVCLNIDLSGQRESCEALPGARLVRLDREGGYVLMRIEQPEGGKCCGGGEPCADGETTVVENRAYWYYARTAKRHADAREADRRLRQGK